ncbi:unnamed protein product, partial [Chrysoparadoxa australica]
MSHNRLRQSNERRSEKLAARWEARLATQVADHDKALERLRGFSRQLDGDVEGLQDKVEALGRQVQRLREGRGRDREVARKSCVKGLKSAREQWAAAEKTKLERLVASRSAAIKQSAVKALEPELQSLVESNRKEQKAKQDVLEVQQQQQKMALEREMVE